MEDKFWNYLTAFILMSAFGMLILTSVILVGDTYSMDTSQIAGGSLSLNKFNESITGIEANAEALKTSFDKQSVWSALAGVVVEGIFGIARDMTTMVLLPLDIVIDIMIDIFGVPAWLTSVLLGLLIMGMILAVWRLIKIGD